MPTARELLEQADALMRRNRSAIVDDIPVLTDSVPEVSEARVMRSRAQSRVTSSPAARDPIPTLTERMAPGAATTDAVVEEGEPSDWLQLGGEPSVIGDVPDSIAIVPPVPEPTDSELEAKAEAENAAESEEIDLAAPETVEEASEEELAESAADASMVSPPPPEPEAPIAAASEETDLAAPETVEEAFKEELAELDAPMAVLLPPEAKTEAETEAEAEAEIAAESEEIDLVAAETLDEAFEEELARPALDAPMPLPPLPPSAAELAAMFAGVRPPEAEPPLEAEIADFEPTVIDEAELEVEAPYAFDVDDQPAVEFAKPEPVADIHVPPIVLPETLDTAMLGVAPEVATAATAAAAPADDARWAAMAEEIRMQVLQRIDLFTDTGLREQLGARLQPIVDRASADLVATINLHVGELLRSYVAEAIEREIESWRRSH